MFIDHGANPDVMVLNSDQELVPLISGLFFEKANSYEAFRFLIDRFPQLVNVRFEDDVVDCDANAYVSVGNIIWYLSGGPFLYTNKKEDPKELENGKITSYLVTKHKALVFEKDSHSQTTPMFHWMISGNLWLFGLVPELQEIPEKDRINFFINVEGHTPLLSIFNKAETLSKVTAICPSMLLARDSNDSSVLYRAMQLSTNSDSFYELIKLIKQYYPEECIEALLIRQVNQKYTTPFHESFTVTRREQKEALKKKSLIILDEQELLVENNLPTLLSIYPEYVNLSSQEKDIYPLWYLAIFYEKWWLFAELSKIESVNWHNKVLGYNLLDFAISKANSKFLTLIPTIIKKLDDSLTIEITYSGEETSILQCTLTWQFLNKETEKVEVSHHSIGIWKVDASTSYFDEDKIPAFNKALNDAWIKNDYSWLVSLFSSTHLNSFWQTLEIRTHTQQKTVILDSYTSSIPSDFFQKKEKIKTRKNHLEENTQQTPEQNPDPMYLFLGNDRVVTFPNCSDYFLEIEGIPNHYLLINEPAFEKELLDTIKSKKLTMHINIKPLKGMETRLLLDDDEISVVPASWKIQLEGPARVGLCQFKGQKKSSGNSCIILMACGSLYRPQGFGKHKWFERGCSKETFYLPKNCELIQYSQTELVNIY